MRALTASCACFAFFVLQGCAHRQVNDMAGQLSLVGPAVTLSVLEEHDPPRRDLAVYLLDRGTLKLYLGDLEGSRQDLESAKQMMAQLEAVSVSEATAAVTINETIRSYDGTPTDQVLVHFMLALGYLLSGELDGARVEMLQADVKMQQLADGDSVAGQLASARFLAGLVYELNGERDDALISYRRAYAIMQARGEPIPLALQISLLNLTYRQGFDAEYDGYRAEFGREHALPGAGESEWLLIYGDGVVSSKIENRFTIWAPAASAWISVTMPDYPLNYYRPRYATLRVDDTIARTDVLESLDARAREDLDREKPALLLTATARAVVKYQAQKQAAQQDPWAGFAATIAAVASEQADLRSWNMLPASIQVARLVAPFDGRATLQERDLIVPEFAELTNDTHILVFATSLSELVLGYPPLEVVPRQDTVSGDGISGDSDSYVQTTTE